MSPDTLTAWAESIGGVIRRLGDMGVSLNLPVIVLVFASMSVVKRLDRRAWARSGRKRGSRPGDNGYLVGWYPAIAIALGALWALAWWGLVDGGTLGGAVASGLVSGALMAAVFHVVKTWSKYRKLLQKVQG